MTTLSTGEQVISIGSPVTALLFILGVLIWVFCRCCSSNPPVKNFPLLTDNDLDLDPHRKGLQRRQHPRQRKHKQTRCPDCAIRIKIVPPSPTSPDSTRPPARKMKKDPRFLSPPSPKGVWFQDEEEEEEEPHLGNDGVGAKQQANNVIIVPVEVHVQPKVSTDI